MTTILYSGYYDPDKDKYPFEVDPNFFYLTSCDLPNVTIIKHHKKDYVLVEIPDISNYDAEHFKMTVVLKNEFNEVCYMSCSLLLYKSSLIKQFTGNFHAYSIENILRYIWIMIIGFLPLFILLKHVNFKKKKITNFLINSEKKNN